MCSQSSGLREYTVSVNNGLMNGLQKCGVVVLWLWNNQPPDLRHGGGVAQWSGRQSVAGGLFVSYLWLTGEHFVNKLSTMSQPTKPNQPAVPSGSVNTYKSWVGDH